MLLIELEWSFGCKATVDGMLFGPQKRYKSREPVFEKKYKSALQVL
jgi:hypothetical protein